MDQSWKQEIRLIPQREPGWVWGVERTQDAQILQQDGQASGHWERQSAMPESPSEDVTSVQKYQWNHQRNLRGEKEKAKGGQNRVCTIAWIK